MMKLNNLKTLAFGLMFSLFGGNGLSAQIYVDVDKGIARQPTVVGERISDIKYYPDPTVGKSWDRPYKSIMQAIWSPEYKSGMIIYVKEGEYHETPNDYETLDGETHTPNAIWGNLPKDKDIIIQASFDKANTGVEITCGYNPGVSNVSIARTTIIKPETGAGKQGLFRTWTNAERTAGSGNITVKGFTYQNYMTYGLNSGAVLSVNEGVKNKTFTFEDCLIDNTQNQLAIGAFYFKGSENSDNTLVLRRTIARNNGMNVIKLITGNRAKIIIDKCHFENNEAGLANGGSVINVSYNASETKPVDIEITNSTFCSNNSSYGSVPPIRTAAGGVIILSNAFGSSNSNSNITLKGNKFYNNKNQYEMGGVLASLYPVNLVAEGNEFYNNQSGYSTITYVGNAGSGGVFALTEGSSLTSKDNKYVGNLSGDSRLGGAVYVQGTPQLQGTSPRVSFENDVFSGNQANQGGAIALEDIPANEVEIKNVQFINNTGLSEGGAVYLNTAAAKINNSIFSGNKAEARGGAITAFNSGLFITGDSKDNNYFINNYAKSEGGAIYVRGTSDYNYTLPANGRTYTTIIDKAGFYTNTVGSATDLANGGSAIFVYSAGRGTSAKTAVTASEFIENKAFARTTGIDWERASGTIKIEQTDIDYLNANTFRANLTNTSTTQAGVDVMTYNGKFTLTNNCLQLSLSGSNYNYYSDYTVGSGNTFSCSTAYTIPASLTAVVIPQSCPTIDEVIPPIIVLCTSCYKTGLTDGNVYPTKHGITSLGRAGADNGNWPMLRQSAHTVLEAKNKGFVINRMASPETTINNPEDGMMVYDTDDKCLKIYVLDSTQNPPVGKWSCFNTKACPDN
ncbi:MAG: hypothetical protein Q4G16_04495 [Cruoricaptor ignavus]|nr:hypothetical protein [Cruoricaptor ignavus]